MLSTFIRKSIRFVPGSLRNAIGTIPVLSSLQRWLMTKASATTFEHQIDHGPCRGLNMMIQLPQDKELWKGTYEEAFVQSLTDAITGDSVCFDIGGWRGYFSAAMKRSGARQVFVFEPMDENQRAIEMLMTLNPGLDVEVFKFAIGRTDGTASFNMMPDNSMGKLASSPFQPETNGQEIQVAVRSIDSLLASAEVPPPDIIKMDIEGAELQALQGAKDTLNQYHPILFIEVHSEDLLKGCSALLEELNYLVEPITERGAIDDRVYHIRATPIRNTGQPASHDN